MSKRIEPTRLRLMLAIMLLLLAAVLTGNGCANDEQEKQSLPTNTSSSAEFINEPGLIDIHAHIGEFKGYDLSLATLLTNIKEHHIEYAFISNIDGAALPGVTRDGDEITINEECARVASANPNLKPLAWAKPGAEKASAANIEPFLRDKKFYGIKFHPEFNDFVANSPVVTPYLRLCEKYHVPAIFHCGRGPRSGPAVIYEAARQFPTVPFVLYHMGFNSSHDEAIAIARTAKEKKDALIYLDTAQTDAETVLKAIKEAGADRVLFGTDATYYGRYHYQHYQPMLRTVKQTVSAPEFQRFIHENAVELFHLNDKSPVK